MNKTIKVCFLILSFCFATVSFSSGLTEETVKQVLSKVDNAIHNLNAEDVSKSLSDNVTITLNIRMKGNTQVMSPSKQEYIAMLRQGWSMYTNYKYSKSNVEIEIQGSKALVTAVVKESMTVQGRNLSGASKEEITIELINGQPLITNMVGYTSM